MTTTISLAIILAMMGAIAWQKLLHCNRLKRMQTHDRVLFPFRQLQRDIVGFLHANVAVNPAALSRAEYHSVRRLLRVLDATVANYDRHKTAMFNLRKVEAYLREHREVLDQIAPPDITANPQIQELHRRFAELLYKAFIAYTPLIRSEVALRLVARAYRVSFDEGKRRVADYVLNQAALVRADARRYGLLGGAAA